jgi:lysophospholipase L1-like esterase
VLAFGDSITNGGGELQWGVALQSWALWVARGLGLPFTGYAADGATARDVVGRQIPAFRRLSAAPQARYDVGCLYIGVNDVRSPGWDPDAFEADFRVGLTFLDERCERVLAVTAPVGLGLPRAGVKVHELDAIVERVALELGVLIVDLRSLAARNLLMADRIHPTALGQLWIAERALAVLHRDGLPARVAPASLISYQTTWTGRLRGDVSYAYRSLKLCGRSLAARAARAERALLR